ncbi:2-phosphosulfolactate phosphatase [Bacillus tianshenii]|nr:2-phosphosulfolactate phosphatase [Bacillus tianshenii]
MQKIHVLMRKEEIDPTKLCNCAVIVIDSLLATSTICMLLQHGAKSVLPVSSPQHALTKAETLKEESYILAGEKYGYDLAGFRRPDPLQLIKLGLDDKQVILSTTNGTVALNNCANAHTVYTASILNTKAVAKEITRLHSKRSVLIVCAGNHGRFSMEDFLTAGSLLQHLSMSPQWEEWELSDGSQAALTMFEETSPAKKERLFLTSETGLFLTEVGYEWTLRYLVEGHQYNIAPILCGEQLTHPSKASI